MPQRGSANEYSHQFCGEINKNITPFYPPTDRFGGYSDQHGGWSGGAKVSCILPHQGVQPILAYSWARPAILVAGKGRGGTF